MKTQPYLSFEGRCEEAIEFYREALGAEVTAFMRFKEMPASQEPQDSAEGCGSIDVENGNKVMHSSFRIGDLEVLASDGMCSGQTGFQGISLALTVPGAAEAERLFNALGDGGQVQMPLTKAFFSPSFGIVADRFGVSWMLVAE
ncbi:MAG TPA: VOC family protein [Thermoanaerobaculia bacterium]|jgi:PhnB protein|nr:VOC family protein [Thermoanaerobaculia bacterium]